MKRLRKAEKRQREDSNSFFYDLCSEGEVSLHVLSLFQVSLPCFSIPETHTYSSMGFVRHLSKVKHFLKSVLCLHCHNICNR